MSTLCCEWQHCLVSFRFATLAFQQYFNLFQPKWTISNMNCCIFFNLAKSKLQIYLYFILISVYYTFLFFPQLPKAEARAEFAERSVQKLQKEVDRLEGMSVKEYTLISLRLWFLFSINLASDSQYIYYTYSTNINIVVIFERSIFYFLFLLSRSKIKFLFPQ